MFKELVRREYAKAVVASPYASEELKRSLKVSERVPNFVDRLSEQLGRADFILAKRGKVVKQETIIGFIHDMTNQWLHLLEKNAEQRKLSDIARSAIAKEVDEKLNPEKTLADMGVMTDDEVQETKA